MNVNSCFFSVQDSTPELVTALEDCEYTFIWFTAAACPLKSNVQNNCTVINPLTGKIFFFNVDISKLFGVTSWS